MTTTLRSKRYQTRQKLVDRIKYYTVEEAVDTIKGYAAGKFDESVDLNFQLGVDPKASDGMIRGSVSLPNGSGKKVRVLCFCKGEEARLAEAAGADYVGSDEYIDKIQKGWFEFDVVVAHPDMMRDISKIGRILGPKGLMPSPKTGAVTVDVGKAVTEMKKGKIELRSDKTGGLHVACGKVSFTKDALAENLRAVVKAVLEIRPVSAKGDYLKAITIASTQGPGLKLQIASALK